MHFKLVNLCSGPISQDESVLIIDFNLLILSCQSSRIASNKTCQTRRLIQGMSRSQYNPSSFLFFCHKTKSEGKFISKSSLAVFPVLSEILLNLRYTSVDESKALTCLQCWKVQFCYRRSVLWMQLRWNLWSSCQIIRRERQWVRNLKHSMLFFGAKPSFCSQFWYLCGTRKCSVGSEPPQARTFILSHWPLERSQLLCWWFTHIWRSVFFQKNIEAGDEPFLSSSNVDLSLASSGLMCLDTKASPQSKSREHEALLKSFIQIAAVAWLQNLATPVILHSLSLLCISCFCFVLHTATSILCNLWPADDLAWLIIPRQGSQGMQGG